MRSHSGRKLVLLVVITGAWVGSFIFIEEFLATDQQPWISLQNEHSSLSVTQPHPAESMASLWSAHSGNATATGLYLRSAVPSLAAVSDVPGSSNPETLLHVADPSKAVVCHTFTPGRLGNHLFEYASILGIARKTNKTFFFVNDSILSRFLKNPPTHRNSPVMQTRCQSAKVKGEKKICSFDETLVSQEPDKDYRVEGYLQSWMYFEGLREDVRNAVIFRDDIVRNASSVVNHLRAAFPNSTLVGVHNRRGDLISPQSINLGYRTASPDFFRRAMGYFRDRFPRVKFIVLSEDKKWGIQNIFSVNKDVIHLETNSDVVDLQILSMTDHMIRTVGTFGWWAAFKMPQTSTVVYLKDFATGLIRALYSPTAKDYMLPEWIGM